MRGHFWHRPRLTLRADLSPRIGAGGGLASAGLVPGWGAAGAALPQGEAEAEGEAAGRPAGRCARPPGGARRGGPQPLAALPSGGRQRAALAR